MTNQTTQTDINRPAGPSFSCLCFDASSIPNNNNTRRPQVPWVVIIIIILIIIIIIIFIIILLLLLLIIIIIIIIIHGARKHGGQIKALLKRPFSLHFRDRCFQSSSNLRKTASRGLPDLWKCTHGSFLTRRQRGHPGLVLSLVASSSANHEVGMQLELSPIRSEPK